MLLRILLLLCLFAFNAFAQSSFAPVVKAVMPSVVSITADLKEDEDVQGVENSLVFENDGHTALGAGFIISEEGYILTNRHVIEKSKQINVSTADGENYIATLVGQDDVTDIALLKIEPNQPLAPAVLADSDTLEVGDWVLAVGNPFGLMNTVTSGIVSAKSRNIHETPFDDYIQTDAPINEGNSGGPLFNTKGEVVGLNTLIFAQKGNSLGVSFAIPSNQIQRVYQSFMQKGDVQHAALAIELKETTLSQGKKALIVTALKDENWALKNDLRVGDVIISYNDIPVSSEQAFNVFISDLDPQTELTFQIYRDGQSTELLVETTPLAKQHFFKKEDINAAD